MSPGEAGGPSRSKSNGARAALELQDVRLGSRAGSMASEGSWGGDDGSDAWGGRGRTGAGAGPRGVSPREAQTSTKFKVRDCVKFVGPGFLMAIAYVDPGNFEVDMQAGAQFGSSLNWVLLISTLAGLLIQVLCVRLSVTTGLHLARLCRDEYPYREKIGLWLLTELAIIASDVPEVIGTAFALKMLLRIPVSLGIVLTSASAMVFLLLQQLGARVLELFFALLVSAISLCFILELTYVGSSAHFSDVFIGLVSIGKLEPPVRVSAYIAVSTLGALVMPHNLFLHSALMLSRDGLDAKSPDGNGEGVKTISFNPFKRRNGAEGIEGDALLDRGGSSAAVEGGTPSKGRLSMDARGEQGEAEGSASPGGPGESTSGLPLGSAPTRLVLLYSGLESAMALLCSLFINVAVVTVTAVMAGQLDEKGREKLISNPLQNAPNLLRNVLGSNAEFFFGLALLASGLSSTMTGTLAGQYVMEGFVNLRIHPVARALLTRTVAILPSLLVTLIAGEAGSEQLIVLSSVVLSFELPFALIPLIKFVCSEKIMGPMALRGFQKGSALAISVVVVAANMFMLCSYLFSPQVASRSVGGVMLVLFLAALGFLYVAVLVVMLRREVKQSLAELNPKRFKEIAPEM